jgi:hypothetical protein
MKEEQPFYQEHIVIDPRILAGVIAWHRNDRPLKLKRMNWQEHSVLVRRRSIPPPKVWPLSPLKEVTLQEPVAFDPEEIHLDDPDNLVDPDGMH